MGVTGLTAGQHNWSIFEMELLAVCLSLEHARNYFLNADIVNICTDHAPLKDIFNKDLSDIVNPWLEYTLHYSIEVVHISGESNDAADTLS